MTSATAGPAAATSAAIRSERLFDLTATMGPDPEADFVELTILRLGLSSQREETAQATRWLDAGDRELLALWWLEAAGELDRSELVAALGLPATYVAVRIGRIGRPRLRGGRLTGQPSPPARTRPVS